MGRIINRENRIYIVDDAFINPAHSRNKDNDRIFYNDELQDFVGMPDEVWTDVIVKNLCSSLISNGWLVYGFSHPNHLLENLENDSSMCPAIIIYDWDYAGSSNESSSILKEILSNYPVYIFVYTGNDKIEEITDLIQSNEFHLYERRISPLAKIINGESSVNSLTTELNNLIQGDFSFMFGSNMRKILLNGIDKTLSKFSNMDINNVLKLLNCEQNEDLNNEIKQMIVNKVIDYIKTSNDVDDIIRELDSNIKIINEVKNILSSKIEKDIISAILAIDTSNSTEEECDNDEAKTLMRELWSYRLYNNPTDNIVRTGDIIREKGSTNYNNLYLVITDNCSLTRFKNKTGGLLNTIELKPLNLFYKDEIQVNNISSLTNAHGFSGTNGKPIMLPYIKINNNYVDYVLFMQNHKCLSVAKANKNDPLLYDSEFNYERVCSVSSEFIHPLIGTIISNLYGWGCDDYSIAVQDDLKARCNQLKSREVADA